MRIHKICRCMHLAAHQVLAGKFARSHLPATCLQSSSASPMVRNMQACLHVMAPLRAVQCIDLLVEYMQVLHAKTKSALQPNCPCRVAVVTLPRQLGVDYFNHTSTTVTNTTTI